MYIRAIISILSITAPAVGYIIGYHQGRKSMKREWEEKQKVKEQKPKMVSFREYSEGVKSIVDLSTCPPQCKRDYLIRNLNVLMERPLCPTCDGTGNELMYMYHKCPDCDGTGIKDEPIVERIARVMDVDDFIRQFSIHFARENEERFILSGGRVLEDMDEEGKQGG